MSALPTRITDLFIGVPDDHAGNLRFGLRLSEPAHGADAAISRMIRACPAHENQARTYDCPQFQENETLGRPIVVADCGGGGSNCPYNQ